MTVLVLGHAGHWALSVGAAAFSLVLLAVLGWVMFRSGRTAQKAEPEVDLDPERRTPPHHPEG